MSAFIVSKKHIDALVVSYLGSLTRFDSQTQKENDALGLMLWEQNHRSVNRRYGEGTETPKYKFNEGGKTPLDLSLMAQLKLLDSYIYQSCKTDDWEETKAYSLCKSLRTYLLKRLIEDRQEYRDAPWVI